MYNFDDLDANLRNQLDANQHTLATTRTETGYRRVRGSAGSGKSLALAGRAAKLVSEGKRILVCNYNIALLNYLEDLVHQFIDPLPPQITFLHFHDWCKFVCQETGHMETYLEERTSYSKHYKINEWFNSRMPELVSEIYASPNTPNLPKYDAILVDEGHDFHVHWWTLLRKALVPKGEALFVCDKTQDLYKTAEKWTEESMLGLGCGFTGPWGELRYNYRLPTGIIPILEDFVEQYLERYDIEANVSFLQQSTLQGEFLDEYRWVQVDQETSVEDVCIKEIELLYNDPDISTVCFLSGKKIGELVAQECEKKGMDIFSTHYMDQRMSRDAKLRLRPGCAGIVATTVHSFKGWEASHLVVHVDKIDNLWDCNVFYTALSRLKRHDNGVALTVVSSCQDLEAFGRKNFPDFVPHGSNIMENDLPTQKMAQKALPILVTYAQKGKTILMQELAAEIAPDLTHFNWALRWVFSWIHTTLYELERQEDWEYGEIPGLTAIVIDRHETPTTWMDKHTRVDPNTPLSWENYKTQHLMPVFKYQHWKQVIEFLLGS